MPKQTIIYQCHMDCFASLAKTVFYKENDVMYSTLNLWEYKFYNHVTVKLHDGRTYTGYVIYTSDEGDELQEMTMSVPKVNGHAVVGFTQSEIESIILHDA